MQWITKTDADTNVLGKQFQKKFLNESEATSIYADISGGYSPNLFEEMKLVG